MIKVQCNLNGAGVAGRKRGEGGVQVGGGGARAKSTLT